MFRKFGFLIVLILSGIFCYAEDLENRFALIIGNQNYELSGIKTAESDCDFVAQSMIKCGFDVTMVKNVTSNQLRIQILDFVKKVNTNKNNSIVVIYYSGHSVQIEETNYLIPIDNTKLSSIKAIKNDCVPVDELFSSIKSNKQILILDSARKNPVPNCKDYLENGLVQIKKLSTSKSCIIMAVEPNVIQPESNTRYSPLASAIGWNFQTVNESFKILCTEINKDVLETTEGRQQIFVQNNDVDFVLLNKEIAQNRIDVLISERTKAVSDAKNILDETQKKSNTNLQNSLNSQISLLKEQKEAAIKDEELRKKNKRKNTQLEKNVTSEYTNRVRNFSKVNVKNLKIKGMEKSPAQFIIDTEKDKVVLQNLRNQAYTKLIEQDDVIQKKADATIQKAMLSEPDKLELKDNKVFTAEAKNKRIQIARQTQEDADNQKKKNYKKYSGEIAREEENLSSKIVNANNTLKSGTYSASSINNEVLYYVKDYDKLLDGWQIRVWSNLLDFNNLFDEHLVIPYSLLKAKEKDVDVLVFNKLFKDKENCPLEVKVDYTIRPLENKASTYYFNATRIVVSYLLANGSCVELCSLNTDIKREMILHPNTKLTSFEEMYLEYSKKENQRIQKEQQIREKKLDTYNDGFSQTEYTENKFEETMNSAREEVGKWGGKQKSINGIIATLGVEDSKFNITAGYAFDFLDNFYVAPILTAAFPSFNGETSGYIGIGANAGVTATYNLDNLPNNSYIEPIANITLGIDTLNVVNFSVMAGCGFGFDEYLIFTTLGASFSVKQGPGFTMNIGGCYTLFK